MALKGACICMLAVLLFLLVTKQTECRQRDPYQVLGVRRSSTQKEITQAFRRLSRQYHPDKNPSKDATEKFQEISAAYDHLTDPSRQSKPWDWDFADPEPNRRRGGRGSNQFGAEFAFGMFQTTYEFVLDLDPVRMWQLGRNWVEQQVQKHSIMLEPLWHGSVDRSICHVLESGWKLPQLLEPILMFGARSGLNSYKAGEWRTWVSSGMLLELSFWVGRQTPCLEYHSSSGHATAAAADAETSDDAAAAAGVDMDKLIELHQQLHTQRKLRQQFLHSQKKASSSSGSTSRSSRSSRKAGSSSRSVVLDGFDIQTVQLTLLQGRLMWCMLLVVSAYLLRKDKLLLAVSLGLVLAGVLNTWWGMASNESSVEALQEMLETNSWSGWWVGCWYVAGCLSLCLLLPLILASCMLLVITWIWAVVSCASIAMAPCMSRFGFALWIALNLWSQTNGELVRGAGVVLFIGFVVYKRPGVLLWWIRLLFAPVLFVYHFIHILLLLQLVWWGWYKPGAAAATQQTQVPPTPDHQQQQQQPQDEEVKPSPAATASPTRPAAAAAAATNGSSPSPDAFSGMPPARPTLKKRAARGAAFTVWAIFNGPWWPNTFTPIDLATTCHWWIRLLGWNMPTLMLKAVGISCKITFAVAVTALAVAAFGASASWLTVAGLVRYVLFRFGVGCGVVWVLYHAFDDLVKFVNPAGYRKKQQNMLLQQQQQRQKEIMRERAIRVQEKMQHVREQQEARQRQQQERYKQQQRL